MNNFDGKKLKRRNAAIELKYTSINKIYSCPIEFLRPINIKIIRVDALKTPKAESTLSKRFIALIINNTHPKVMITLSQKKPVTLIMNPAHNNIPHIIN